MSLDHILCSPPDRPALALSYYGLPSPTSSYHSDDDAPLTPTDCEHRTLAPICYKSDDTKCHHSLNDRHRQVVVITPPRQRRSQNSSAAQMSRRVPWTPDEDELLKQGYEQGLSWAMIASTYLPHRSRGCCWGRLKTLKNKRFLSIQRQLRVKSRPWKTLNPLDMQQQSLSKS